MSSYFTVTEANRLLPKVRTLATEMVNAHRKIVVLTNQVESVLEKSQYDSGSRSASELVMLFDRFESVIKQLQDMGLQIKDPSIGLCDFPARYNGQDILLCWKLGETAVEWWHDIESGFRGRRHVSELGS